MTKTVRTRVPLAVTALLALLGPASLAGQQAPPDRWDFKLELGVNGASGNSSFTILRAGASAKHLKTDRYELEFSTVVRYGTNEEKVIANDAKGSVTFDWHPEATWSPFLFADVARDKVRNLDFQANGGLGAKWTFVQDEVSDLSVSLATLYDYQNFALPAGSTDPGTESLVRWSARFRAVETLGQGTELKHTTFFQPVVDNIGDYVIEITNTLSTQLLGNLTMALEHVYLRDEVPPPGAAKDDQKYSVLFKLEL